MSHDPERDAAAYLGGDMSAKRTAVFEEHLLECEACWREVSEGRSGRALAESAREHASQQLREDVRTAVAAYPLPAGRPLRLRLAVAAALLLIVAGSVTYLALRTPSQPTAIAAAVTDFRSGRLPAVDAPTRSAPDLSRAGLEYVGGGAGRIGKLRIDAFAYRDRGGGRVFLYLSDKPFPVAAGARRSQDARGPWTATDGDVDLLCAQRPHALLLLGQDREVLASAAKTIGAR